jgi:hypothetical protein
MERTFWRILNILQYMEGSPADPTFKKTYYLEV